MKLPRKLEIKGRMYSILEHEIDQNYYGFHDYDKKTIELKKGLKLEDKKKTFFHELLHAIISESGLRQTSLSIDVEEAIVENIANYLVDKFNFTFKK